MVRYLIRKATLEDIPVIRKIAMDNWWTSEINDSEKKSIQLRLDKIYSLENLTEQMETGTQFYILLQEKTGSVAFLSWTTSKQTIMIHQIYCLTSTQGKGYVKILINEISSIAMLEGIKFLEIEVNDDVDQVRYFEKLGFTLKLSENIARTFSTRGNKTLIKIINY